jgi:4'-phosphopantetheinyl transferase
LNDDIYVWDVNLDRPEREVEGFRPLLSKDERERASRLRAPGLERRFIVCRATLRLLLARELSRRPDQLECTYSAAGKPDLKDHAAHGLYFNLTHSSESAKIAVSRVGPLGIDLEHIRPDFATMPIAERFFSPAEQRALRQSPESDKAAAFFRCWTRKEAFVKAVGTGIGYPLDAFDVAIEPNSQDALLAVRVQSEAAQPWSIRDIPAKPGFAAAIAIPVKSAKLLPGGPIG